MKNEDIRFMNRRKFTRHPIEFDLSFSAEGENDIEMSTSCNISEEGIMFYSNRKYTVGSVIRINMRLGKTEYEVCGEVRWCRAPDSGKYLVGIRFLGIDDIFRIRVLEDIEFSVLKIIQNPTLKTVHHAGLLNLSLGSVKHNQTASRLHTATFQFMRGFGIKVNRLTRLEELLFIGQRNLQVTLHNIDKLFTLMLVGYWFVILIGFNAYHKSS